MSKFTVTVSEREATPDRGPDILTSCKNAPSGVPMSPRPEQDAEPHGGAPIAPLSN
jgi:hypothetical protein